MVLGRAPCKEACSAMMGCKALWHKLGNALVHLEGLPLLPSQQGLASLLRFQERRKPLGLKAR